MKFPVIFRPIAVIDSAAVNGRNKLWNVTQEIRIIFMSAVVIFSSASREQVADILSRLLVVSA